MSAENIPPICECHKGPKPPSEVLFKTVGCTVTNKDLVVLDNHNIIMRRDYKSMTGKVKIIGGGGAGIEPAEVNYIGKGMLTAAVLGELYAAPSADEVLMAIRELSVDSTEGILLLVKNYIGDKLNFGLAMERATIEGLFVKMLVLGDDACEPILEKHGRRGLAGCTLVYKIAGEMAEQEKCIEDIIEECRDSILTDMATVSLTLPACGKTFSESLAPFVEPDEMVLGMGIYAFEEDSATRPPGIFLWNFLTPEDCDALLAGESDPTHFMTYIEPKLEGDQTLFAILLNETYKFCRENYDTDKRRISALVGTVYYTHLYFTASMWRNSSEVYYYFRESMLCQAVEFPPKSTEVFSPEEVKNALIFFIETYVRNLPLVRILHLPHYKLRLKIKDEPEDQIINNGTLKTVGGKL